MTLDKDLRSLLEKTTIKARVVAEEAAMIALEKLAVNGSEAFGFMDESMRSFRRELRALGRAKGDIRSKDATQDITHLSQYVAYEHWHRMLFARFLAENELLCSDGLQVTLEDCEELAAEGEEGAKDGFELACIYAAKQLPQIFRQDDPANKLTLDRARYTKLKELLDFLPTNTFTASDALGWVYQFWQTAAKEAANKAGDKINADTLPAVTQLFTEPYMVQFNIDNTLGAWWINNDRTHASPEHAPTKQDFPYLRDPSTQCETPKESDGEAETDIPNSQFLIPNSFPSWPQRVQDLKILDPSMGSGHFLITLFPLLAKMRMAEQGLSREDAAKAVLAENLHGLELDPRCAEIAAFALALTAWKFAPDLVTDDLPALNLACCGLRIKEPVQKWLDMVEPEQAYLMEQLHGLFTEAPELGSLINPSRQLFELTDTAHFNALLPTIEKALKNERQLGRFEESESGVTARGLASAYRILRGSYHLVITNVPYLARGKQDEALRNHIEKYYNDGKADLATAFVERCLEFCAPGGTTTLVTPQNWLFLTSYKQLRKGLLEDQSFDWIARLGPKGFQTPMWDFNVMLFSLTRQKPTVHSSYWGLDASADKTPSLKSQTLQTTELKSVPQLSQLENPDERISFEEGGSMILLSKYASALNGLHGADSLRFRFKHWELKNFLDWTFLQNTASETSYYSGRGEVFYWKDNGEFHSSNEAARIQGDSGWGKGGIVVSMMSELDVSLSTGEKFDISCSPIIPENPDHIPAIWCFCSSPQFNEEVRKIDQKLSVTNATLVKVPFDLEHWQKVADEKYPDGLPAPYSNDPTQWLFKGRIDDTEDSNILHVAMARLLGYRWPAELDPDKAGVKILDEDKAHWETCAPHVDNDGIVCLHSENREPECAERLRHLLASALGNYDELALIAATGSKKKKLEDWLKEDFFTQHTKLFHHRPFIWHIWDGRPDGFHALLHYHQLDYKNLEKLTYTYLGDWIRDQTRDAKADVPGAAERQGAAEALQQRLKRILEGDAPYDIFVRWKPLADQSSGWHPDLNDGVRMNIRPFMIKDLPNENGSKFKKGAGILRTKPNIKWAKDRGKDPTSAPWFPTHQGDRINEHHISLEEKAEN